MKIEDAIKELTLLREEHGNVDLYISLDVNPFMQYIEKGQTAPVSAASYIVFDEADGTGVEASVTIRDWPY